MYQMQHALTEQQSLAAANIKALNLSPLKTKRELVVNKCHRKSSTYIKIKTF